jgi:hypothetical protein
VKRLRDARCGITYLRFRAPISPLALSQLISLTYIE